MADLRKSLQLLWKLEYSGNINLALHTVQGDPGGMTYKGISRKNWPHWEGWGIIDSCLSEGKDARDMEQDEYLQFLVFRFYESEFWDPIHGYYIVSQSKADNIFNFGVVAGIGTSIMKAQEAARTTVDGIFGENTLESVNNTGKTIFNHRFNKLEEEHFKGLVKENSYLSKFLEGWLNRAWEV